jgi:hypothetical protein
MADAVLWADPFALRPAHSRPLGALVHCRRWSRDCRRHPRPRARTTQHGPRKGSRAAMWRSEVSARSRILGLARCLNVWEHPGTRESGADIGRMPRLEYGVFAVDLSSVKSAVASPESRRIGTVSA